MGILKTLLDVIPQELQKGDIVIFQPLVSDKDEGHIQMWDGENWGSDFRQSGFWPGPSYRQYKPSYEFYRYFIALIFVGASGIMVERGLSLMVAFLDCFVASLLAMTVIASVAKQSREF